jgi:amino acid adenylation domain-containing protein
MKKNILEFFLQTVKDNFNKIAVIDGDQQLTFGELGTRSQVLASELIGNNLKINKPVAVFLPKSVDSVVANIAITYSCNIYMNIDIKSPNERIKNILNLIIPDLIITNTTYLKLLDGIIARDKIILFDEIDFCKEPNMLNLQSRMRMQIDTDPLCIINTSGSTGTPKGVVLNHRSFIEFTERSLEIFDFKNNEVIGSLSPLVFDIYSFELCLLMAKGSTLVLIPDHLSAFPMKILELLNKHKVSFIFWVPTIMVNIANMELLDAIDLPELRIVWFAGEVFPTKQFNYWKKRLSHTLFANLYGPIEITLDCTYFIVNREIADNEPIPIGIPYKNTDILILNDNNELINKGEEGELCIRGTSLAMGYYNNPEKTAAVFVQNPLNHAYPEIIYRTGDVVCFNERGELIFKGRKDTLIKHFGYRIELGEIEHVIVNVLQIVKNCCIIYQIEKKEITAIYESLDIISDVEFRKKLLLHFPKYMIPTKYIRMDELPRNTNGKIDRLTLKLLINEN